MNESKYTPSPWRYNLYDSETNFILSNIDIDADDEGRSRDFGCSILEGSLLAEDSEELQANARLIAAAPDLLETLQSLIAATEKSLSLPLEEMAQAMKRAKAAIEKALTGKEIWNIDDEELPREIGDE